MKKTFRYFNSSSEVIRSISIVNFKKDIFKISRSCALEE